jgi:hypothetical protein
MDTQSEVIINIGSTHNFNLRGSAGTGYAWMLADLPKGTWLESVEITASALPGGPYTQTFIVFGAHEGKGTLRFVLVRPWEPNRIVDEQVFQLRVQKGSPIVALYAVAIQQAAASGDLARMKALAADAEKVAGKNSHIDAALPHLKSEIAKLEARG